MVETIESTFIAITHFFSAIPVDAIAKTLMSGATRMMAIDPRQAIMDGSGVTSTNMDYSYSSNEEGKQDVEKIIVQAQKSEADGGNL
jgi:hypothetical protein